MGLTTNVPAPSSVDATIVLNNKQDIYKTLPLTTSDISLHFAYYLLNSTLVHRKPLLTPSVFTTPLFAYQSLYPPLTLIDQPRCSSLSSSSLLFLSSSLLLPSPQVGMGIRVTAVKPKVETTTSRHSESTGFIIKPDLRRDSGKKR